MRLILSLLLTISTLFSAFTAARTPDAARQAEAPAVRMDASVMSRTEALRAAPAQRVGDHADLDYADIPYVHYDPTLFYADTEELCRLADEGDDDGVVAMYDTLYDEFCHIDTLTVLAMLNHDRDIYDEYWTAENAYMSSLWNDAQNELLTACCYVMDTDCRRALSRHAGRDAARLFASYEPMPEDELAAYDREIELTDQYFALFDTIDDIQYSYLGESWSFDKLYGFPGTALYESDYDGYMEIYYGLHQAVSETFAPLYIELVELWTEMARSAGYDSYTDYAYEMLYWRDYTPEDAQRLCDAVKPIAKEYYADLYYSDIAYAADGAAPLPEGGGLIDLLGEYLPRIDEGLTEPWQYMTEHGLYDVQGPGSGRFDGAYTTTMLYYRAPFLFATLDGSCQDLITVSHEFGHYCDYYFSPMTDMLTQADSLDLSEIHSNALQALFTAFYGDIYETGADIAEYANIAFLLENIFDGCFYDEFQRRVLAEPDGLTTERINEIMTQLCMEYGMYDEPRWDGTWAYIPHNFQRPLYYFSYAASAIAALQIWDIAQTDFDAAAAVYMDVLSRGSHGDEYLQVLEDCGLTLFTEDGAAEQVCRPVLDHLAALDRAYYAG